MREPISQSRTIMDLHDQPCRHAEIVDRPRIAGAAQNHIGSLTGCSPSSGSDDRLRVDQAVTAFVAGVKSAWPSRALADDDKRVLKSLAKAAETGIDDGLARLLPGWIISRYKLRR